MKANNFLGLQILNRISSKENNLIYKYSCSDFSSLANGVSFFFRYKGNLLKAMIYENDNNIEILIFGENLNSEYTGTKTNMLNLAVDFEKIVDKIF